MPHALPYDDLFFDFDDTLYDTHGNATLSLAELYAAHQLHQFAPDYEVFATHYWAANHQLWAAYARDEISKDFLIVERFRRPLAQCAQQEIDEAFCLQLHHSFMALNAQKSGTVEGAQALIEALQARGYRLHICSNGFADALRLRLQQCGLRPYFSTIIDSETAGANKPSPLFFSHAFAQSGAQPERTLMIGDSWENDILGAQRYGFDTLFFNPQAKRPASSTAATYEVASLAEIAHIL